MPRQIDVESGRIAVGAGVVERRVIDLGEEADHVMRDRSGRSGRRRGSQKPGTAIGLLTGLAFGAVAAGAVSSRGGTCACAHATSRVRTAIASIAAQARPPRSSPFKFAIRRSKPPIQDLRRTIASSKRRASYNRPGRQAVRCFSISCTGSLTKSLSISRWTAARKAWL